MARAGLRIGAVAERLGIPAATLRTWERRYGLTRREHAAGQDRRYTDDDVQRLVHIVALRERGERVADLAHLSLEDLAVRRVTYEKPAGAPSTRQTIEVVLYGFEAMGLAGATLDGRAEVVVKASRSGLPEVLPEADVVFVDIGLLGPRPVDGLRETNLLSSGMVVFLVYRFAPQAWLERFAMDGVRTIRLPTSPHDLQASVVDAILARRGGHRWVAPELNRVQLSRMEQRDARTSCECPNHLASINLALLEFEAYVAMCEVEKPEDAALHRRLELGAYRARGIVESLLKGLCTEEGIEWPTDG